MCRKLLMYRQISFLILNFSLHRMPPQDAPTRHYGKDS
jgi:hypothetical protein